MASSSERFAQQVAALSRRLDQAIRKPQLGNSSLENTSLKVKDASGVTTMIIGQQFDGSAGAAIVNGPTPATPSAPDVDTVSGGLAVRSFGTFADGSDTAMDFARWDVHVSTASNFTPSASTKRAEIASSAGGWAFVSWSGQAYVRLTAVSMAGKVSPASVQFAVNAGTSVQAQIDALTARLDNLTAAQIRSNGALNNGVSNLQADIQFLWTHRNDP